MRKADADAPPRPTSLLERPPGEADAAAVPLAALVTTIINLLRRPPGASSTQSAG
jgi:hypothetical protein